MVKPFKNIQGDGKVNVRSMIIDLIETIKPKRTFTLPNLVFEAENVAAKYGEVITCEIDSKVYKKQLKLNLNKNIKLNNCKASKIFEKYNFDFVWLDLCGSYSEELIECLDCLKTDNLVVTISRCRGINVGNPDYFYKALFARYNFKTNKVINYNDTSPMTVYFLENLYS